MRSSALLISAAFLVAVPALADEPPKSLASGTELNAVLMASLDSGDVKPGDKVTAKTTQAVKAGDGTILLPKSSTLMGVVTAAGRHGVGGSGVGGSRAVLGVLFDHAVGTDGQPIVLGVTLVALAVEPPRSERRDPQDPVVAGTGTLSTAGGTLETVGGVVTGTGTPGTAGRVTTSIGPEAGRAINRSAGAVGGVASNGRLTAGSRGVFGIEDLEISASASNSDDGTILVSPRSTVNLERGTQLLLVAGS
jgi:hypothetical protein